MQNYLHGLGNYFESEAEKGALIKGQNTPQKVPLGLYAEQLSGAAFTMSRHLNMHSWLYRIRPSVLQGEFVLANQKNFINVSYDAALTPPNPMRWDPMPHTAEKQDFIEGLFAFAGNGSAETQMGAAIYLYSANRSMEKTFFYNADGEMLIVPEQGKCRFKTELGVIDVKPGEIIVIPRGIKFQVLLLDQQARGYVCENYGAPFRLPELGVIGANGLANARDFQIPVAHYDDDEDDFILRAKFQGKLWEAKINHSPLDVVAWHGSYVPYKYDLSLFNTINTVSYDHIDPSIFTVLTSPSNQAGVANVDFVIFPPRWMVAQNTFRPPYFHRNIMSEFMGLIFGTYDAKGAGFTPGSCSLHNCMSPHGPDADAYNKAVSSSLKPEYYADTLAFMFESRQVWCLTSQAYHAAFRQKDYLTCWQGLTSHFSTESSL